MARARNIKPSTMDNERLAELAPLTRLLFVYLWMLADREGRLEDRPRRIAAQALAYDREADVGAMLDDLHRAGFIARYEADGVACIQVLNFSKHQTPHIREAASALPPMGSAPTKDVPSTNLGSAEASPGSPESGLRIPDTGLLNDDSAPAGAVPAKPAEKPAVKKLYSDDFEAAWDAYPRRPGASKPDAHKAWAARVKAGVAVEALLEGARRYAAYCAAAQTDPQFIKQPATFFGPGDHYLSEWSLPTASKGHGQNKYAAAAAGIFDKPRPLQETIDV